MTDADLLPRERLAEYAARYGRPLSVWHSCVAHRDLGYCSACVTEGQHDDEDGNAVELLGWRLLAMAERGMIDWTNPEVVGS